MAKKITPHGLYILQVKLLSESKRDYLALTKKRQNWYLLDQSPVVSCRWDRYRRSVLGQTRSQLTQTFPGNNIRNWRAHIELSLSHSAELDDSAMNLHSTAFQITFRQDVSLPQLQYSTKFSQSFATAHSVRKLARLFHHKLLGNQLFYCRLKQNNAYQNETVLIWHHQSQKRSSDW